MKKIRYKIYLKPVSILLLLGIVIVLFLDIREVGTIDPANGSQNIFVDSIGSELVFNHGSTYEKDSLFIYSYKSKYGIVLLKLNSQKNINNENVQVQFKKNISDFSLFYTSVDLGNDCLIMKRNTSHIEDIDKLVLQQGVRHNNDSSKGFFFFKTKKFSLGNNQNGPELIFDFNEREAEIVFSIFQLNNSTFIFVLYSLDETKALDTVLSSIIKPTPVGTPIGVGY